MSEGRLKDGKLDHRGQRMRITFDRGIVGFLNPISSAIFGSVDMSDPKAIKIFGDEVNVPHVSVDKKASSAAASSGTKRKGDEPSPADQPQKKKAKKEGEADEKKKKKEEAVVEETQEKKKKRLGKERGPDETSEEWAARLERNHKRVEAAARKKAEEAKSGDGKPEAVQMEEDSD